MPWCLEKATMDILKILNARIFNLEKIRKKDLSWDSRTEAPKLVDAKRAWRGDLVHYHKTHGFDRPKSVIAKMVTFTGCRISNSIDLLQSPWTPWKCHPLWEDYPMDNSLNTFTKLPKECTRSSDITKDTRSRYWYYFFYFIYTTRLIYYSSHPDDPQRGYQKRLARTPLKYSRRHKDSYRHAMICIRGKARKKSHAWGGY